MIHNSEWCKQQVNERNREKSNMSQADRLYDLKAREMDQRAMELAESEHQCRQAINFATTEFNISLANEKKTKQNLEKTQELDDNFTEISNQVFGESSLRILMWHKVHYRIWLTSSDPRSMEGNESSINQ